MEKFSRPDRRCCKNVCCARRPNSAPWRSAKISSRATSVSLFVHIYYIIIYQPDPLTSGGGGETTTRCVTDTLTHKFSVLIKCYFAIRVHPTPLSATPIFESFGRNNALAAETEIPTAETALTQHRILFIYYYFLHSSAMRFTS